MSWHIAPALKQMLAEVNKKWPNRSRLSDGGIGNAAHSARASDHNPNGRGSVNAYDITIAGIDEGTLIAQAKKHPSVRYIIFNRRIMNRDIGNFRARYYSGSNPHNKHVHISLYQSAAAENRRQSWGLANAKPVSGVGGGGGSSYGNPNAKHEVGSRIMRKGSAGTDVQWLQKRLYKLGYTITPKKNGTFDGMFGPEVDKAVRALQRAAKIAVDGDAGKDTIAAAKGAKVKRNLPSKPKHKKSKAPKFPLPKGHWYGPESRNKKNHSGYYAKDRAGIKQFQNKLKSRGWKISADGFYGPNTKKIVRQFQAEKKIRVDGGVGAVTWAKIWEAPVT